MIQIKTNLYKKRSQISQRTPQSRDNPDFRPNFYFIRWFAKSIVWAYFRSLTYLLLQVRQKLDDGVTDPVIKNQFPLCVSKIKNKNVAKYKGGHFFIFIIRRGEKIKILFEMFLTSVNKKS